MKKYTLCLLLMSSLTFVSCKKFDEKESVKEVNEMIKPKKVSKKNFDENIFPLVDELYKSDTVKYKMINHIATKAKNEKNEELYKLNLQNLKDEMKFIN